MSEIDYGWRRQPQPADVERVRALVQASGFFSVAEIAIAAELVAERLSRGLASGYEFLFAERDDELLGYACFGAIDGTQSSYDLYWIAVAPERQRCGIGRALLARSERLIAAAAGTRVYVETSSRPQYAPTRAFYRRCGYRQAAWLEDFYRAGDGKVIFVKVLTDYARP